MKITNEAVHVIYDLSKEVYHKTKSVREAVRVAVDEGLMAEGSAKIYVKIFDSLMKGLAHKRAMNEYSTRYFLESILKDYGRAYFLNALSSTSLHITYYNSLKKGKRASISKVVEELSNKYSVSANSRSIYPDEISDSESYIEGAKKRVTVNSYERNAKARNKCLEHYGFDCAVCSFNFEKLYGELGISFIHVHHIVDIATLGETYNVDPVKDLRPVCPNCHAMLHRTKPAISIDELSKLIEESSSI